mgnify:CR=1 FL=1
MAGHDEILKGKSYAQLTNYPSLFKYSYWGSFVCDDYDNDQRNDLLEIVNNRNIFVNEFDIKARITVRDVPYWANHDNAMQQYINFGQYITYFDHMEAYEIIKGKYYIIVSSPYSSVIHDETILDKSGFIPYKKLYNKRADTFIKHCRIEDYKHQFCGDVGYSETKCVNCFLYYCPDCNYRCHTRSSMTKHMRTNKHQKNVN